MAGRRGWLTLSEAYRRRLEKGGITRALYERGASLKSARGHETTPESPREYMKNPSRFKEYRERRKDIVARVVEKKKAAFDATVRWNEEHSKLFVERGATFDGKPPPARKIKVQTTPLFIRPPTMKQLKKIDAMSVDELLEYQYTVKDDEDWRFLWYH